VPVQKRAHFHAVLPRRGRSPEVHLHRGRWRRVNQRSTDRQHLYRLVTSQRRRGIPQGPLRRRVRVHDVPLEIKYQHALPHLLEGGSAGSGHRVESVEAKESHGVQTKHK